MNDTTMMEAAQAEDVRAYVAAVRAWLADLPGALWTRALLEECREPAASASPSRVVVGVDPPASEGGDACGIVVVALLGGYLAERLRITGGALEEATERAAAAERLAELGRLSAGLAHEIRNPLGSISGSVEMLRESPALSDEDKQLCAIISREASRSCAMSSRSCSVGCPVWRE